MQNGRLSRFRIAVGTSLIAVAVGWEIWQAQAADDDLKPDVSLTAFMRKKLEASSQILEGLTTEDSDLIERGANALLRLSNVEMWQVLTDSEYREYSVKFRSTVKKLHEAAEKGNFDNAALQWIDAMKSCIECHQHVRRERTSKK